MKHVHHGDRTNGGKEGVGKNEQHIFYHPRSIQAQVNIPLKISKRARARTHTHIYILPSQVP